MFSLGGSMLLLQLSNIADHFGFRKLDQDKDDEQGHLVVGVFLLLRALKIENFMG